MSTQTRDPGAAGASALDRGPRDEPGAGLLDALAEAERASMKPPAQGERQTWERVVASVAAGGAPAVPPSSISGPASAAASTWAKVVLGLVLGGVVLATGYALSTDPAPEPVSTVAATGDADPPPRQSSAPQRTEAPRAQPPPPSQPALQAPPSPSAPAVHTAPARPVRAAAPRSGAAASSNLTEETRLLARARARLRAGSPADALPPLAEHARRFPDGQLAEDRLVLQAQALCESGDVKAGSKTAAALRKAFPRSSHLPRVTRACE